LKDTTKEIVCIGCFDIDKNMRLGIVGVNLPFKRLDSQFDILSFFFLIIELFSIMFVCV
jgi:hypothetical protein